MGGEMITHVLIADIPSFKVDRTRRTRLASGSNHHGPPFKHGVDKRIYLQKIPIYKELKLFEIRTKRQCEEIAIGEKLTKVSTKVRNPGKTEV